LLSIDDDLVYISFTDVKINFGRSPNISISSLCGDKYVNILKWLTQVAPYERPALSKGFLLPEGIDSSLCQLILSFETCSLSLTLNNLIF